MTQEPKLIAAPAKNVRIAVVEDDERVRTSLADAIGRFAGFECVGCFDSGETALVGVPRLQPDVVLMDINMPGMNGIACVDRLKATDVPMEIIMLTVYQDADNVFKSLAAGANGYLLKRADRAELIAAIRQVLDGGSPMSSQIARKVVQAFRQPDTAGNENWNLSPREQEVLALLAKGYIYKEIAGQLDIGYDTVHNYIRRVYEKLRVRSRAQAVAKYFGQAQGPTLNAPVRR